MRKCKKKYNTIDNRYIKFKDSSSGSPSPLLIKLIQPIGEVKSL